MRRRTVTAENRQVVARADRLPTRDGEDWLTPREAAQHLRVGVDSIYDACAAKGLKHVKLGYRTIRLRRQWIDDWADSQVQEHK